jgi:hypothetical protein
MADIDDVYDLLLKLQPQLQEVYNNVDRRNSSAIETLMADCVAHYKMNDNADSTVVIDSIGTSNGTSVRNTSLMHIAGVVGGALSFNGSDYINLNDSFASLMQNDFTINITLNPTELAGLAMKYIVGAYTTAANSGLFIYLHGPDNKIEFDYYNGAGGYVNLLSSITFDDLLDKWSMITCTAKKLSSTTAEFKIYLNKVLVADSGTRNIAMASYSQSNDMYLGSTYFDGDPADPFKGAISSAEFFDTTLSDVEIALLYNANEEFATAASVELLAADVTLLKNIQEGDWYIDKTDTAQYQIVIHKKGDTATEYIRKDMKKADGTAITDVSQMLAQLTEPT